jgi:uncharacterized protein (TIGR02145 family)
MKKLITILSMLPLLIMAQAPQGFTYQGVATDNNGFELQNQTISIQASILSSSATGATVWQETHTTSTDTFGLFNVTIGEGTSTNSGSSATFQEIDWGAASHFMKVEIDVNGGSNYVHVGTSQMMSVPYALYAKNSENADNANDSIRISPFGDSLIINGYSIIIPGLSYQNIAPTFGSVTDYDGNTYSTIDYGGAGEWMTENLRITKFSNGDPINVAIFNYNGGNLSHPSNQTGQYANYFTHSYNDASGNGSPQMFFYNGFAMQDSRNVCPTGWHVPTRSEWIQLIELFGDVDPSESWNSIHTTWNQSGSAVKDINYWSNAITYSTNYSHMSAYPSGLTDAIHGNYYGHHDYTFIWTSTLTGYSDGYTAGVWQMYLHDTTFDAKFQAEGLIDFGCIRCKKD